MNIVKHNTNKRAEPNPTHVILRESLFRSSTTENEAITTFVNLSQSKCRNADGFQIKPIKVTIDLFSPISTPIFNLPVPVFSQKLCK